MKLGLFKKSAFWIVIILLIQLFTILKLNQTNSKLSSSVISLSNSQKKAHDDLSSVEKELIGQIGTAESLRSPIELPNDNKLYIPEMKITIPLNEISKSIKYGFDSENQEIGINSTSNLDQESGFFGNRKTQFSCDSLARISLQKSAGANSPWEKKIASIKLADGRNVTIMTAVNFTSNEGSTKWCADNVWNNVTPAEIGDLFKKAKSY